MVGDHDQLPVFKLTLSDNSSTGGVTEVEESAYKSLGN